MKSQSFYDNTLSPSHIRRTQLLSSGCFVINMGLGHNFAGISWTKMSLSPNRKSTNLRMIITDPRRRLLCSIDDTY